MVCGDTISFFQALPAAAPAWLAFCVCGPAAELDLSNRRVFVKTLKECTFVVDCDAASTVVELKHKVAEQDAQWDVQRQR